MQTLRGRLTAWYSGALALTLAAFAGVLYLDRRSASYQDLDQRIQSEAALTAGILAESYRARGTLVRADTAHHPVLIPDLAALLEAVPDFLVITARDGSLLFASSDARALTFQQVEQLRRLASAPSPDGPAARFASSPTARRSTMWCITSPTPDPSSGRFSPERMSAPPSLARTSCSRPSPWCYRSGSPSPC